MPRPDNLENRLVSATEQKALINGPAGELELRWIEPGQNPLGIAVICHPHPLHGGTMDNKVVYTLQRCLQALGFVAVRFNFRGVGRSAGEFDQGLGERADLGTVVQWSKQRFGVNLPLWLAGFSFGSYVSATAANELAAVQLISIAPPVQRFDFSQFGNGQAMPQCPWLVVMGDADEVVDPAAVFAWLADLQPAPRVIRMAGAGHYFHGRLVELSEILNTELSSAIALLTGS